MPEHCPNQPAAERARAVDTAAPATRPLPVQPGSRWTPIDRLRETARRVLDAVERESGRQSPLYALCVEAWRRAEREALVSLLHADFTNAATLLDLAVHRMARGREVARRGELGLEELGALMRAP